MPKTTRRIIDAAHAPGMFATWHSGIMSTTKDPRMTNSQIVKKVCQHPDPERVIELFKNRRLAAGLLRGASAVYGEWSSSASKVAKRQASRSTQ